MSHLPSLSDPFPLIPLWKYCFLQTKVPHPDMLPVLLWKKSVRLSDNLTFSKEELAACLDEALLTCCQFFFGKSQFAFLIICKFSKKERETGRPHMISQRTLERRIFGCIHLFPGSRLLHALYILLGNHICTVSVIYRKQNLTILC